MTSVIGYVELGTTHHDGLAFRLAGINTATGEPAGGDFVVLSAPEVADLTDKMLTWLERRNT